jgi:HAMP domain-containing protein
LLKAETNTAMPQYIKLPNGSFLELAKGQRIEEALAKASEAYPDAFVAAQEPAPPAPAADRQGFMAGIRSGIENLKGDVGALGAGLGIEGGEAYARAQAAKAAELYQQPGFTEAPVDYVTGMLGQSLPYVAAPVAAALGAATLPLTGTAATVAGLGAAGLASATQFTGSNLARQLDEGRTTDTLELGNAALAAIPQAALDTLSLKLLPGIGRIFGTAGKELTEDAAQAAARAVLARGTGNLVKQYGGAAVKTAGIEGLTETGQQVLERMQAELEMLDPEARGEYLDSFIGGAILGGTLAVPGKAFERGAERSKLAEIDRRKAQAAAPQETAEGTVDESSDQYALDFEKQFLDLRGQMQALEKQKRQIDKTSPDADLDREHNRQISAQIKALGEENGYKEMLAQYVSMQPRIAKAKQTLGAEQPQAAVTEPEAVAEEEVAVEQQSPQALDMEQMLLDNQQRMSDAAAAADIPTIKQLQQARTLMTDIAKMTQQLRGMTGPGSDPAKIAKLVEKIEAAQAQLASMEGAQYAVAPAPVPQAVTPESTAVDETAPEQPAAPRAKRAPKAAAAPVQPTAVTEAEPALADTEAQPLAVQAVEEAPEPEPEKGVMDTSQTLQQTMFPQDEARSGIVSGAANSRAQLESELKLARVTGNKQAADLAIEQLRELQARGDKAAEPISALGDTRDLQEAFGSKLPQNVQRLQAASDARARSYAEMVSILDRFNKGKAKQADLNAAETQVYSSLISEVEALRGEPMAAPERTDLTRAARNQVQDLLSRFGDTRDVVDVGQGKDKAFVPEDSPLASQGKGTELGITRYESREPGQRTLSNRYAAAKSIEEALNEIRNRFVGPAKKQNIERTVTPSITTASMLDQLVARIDPRRLSDVDAALFEDIKAELPSIKAASTQPASPGALPARERGTLAERGSDIVGEYLYSLATARTSPELRRDVRNLLDSINPDTRSGDMFADAIPAARGETKGRAQAADTRGQPAEKQIRTKGDIVAAAEALFPVYNTRTLVSFEKRRNQIEDIIGDLGREKVQDLIERIEVGTDAELNAISSEERAAAAAQLRAITAKIDSRMEKRDATLQTHMRIRAEILNKIAQESDALSRELLNKRELNALTRGKSRAELEQPKRDKIQNKIKKLYEELNARDDKIKRTTGVTQTTIKTSEQQRQEQKDQLAETRDREAEAIARAEQQLKDAVAAVKAAKQRGGVKAVRSAEAVRDEAQLKLDDLVAAKDARVAETNIRNEEAIAEMRKTLADAEADLKEAEKTGDVNAIRNAKVLRNDMRYRINQLTNAAGTRGLSPATKTQSTEPRKFRTASEESKAGLNETAPDAKIKEKRGVKERDTPMSAKEMKAANKVAETMPDVDRTSGAAAAESATVKAAETSVERARKNIAAKQDELRFASRENAVGTKGIPEIRAELESLERNLVVELSRLETVRSQYAADELRKQPTAERTKEVTKAKKKGKQVAAAMETAEETPKQTKRKPKVAADANRLQDAVGDVYYGDAEFGSAVRNADYDSRPTVDLTTTVKADVRAGRLEDALFRLQDEGSTPFVRELAKRIAPFLKGVTLVSNPNVVDSNGVPVEALYTGDTMQVQISSATGMTEEAFLHELVHPATLTLLRADPAMLTAEQRQARQDLQRLFDQISTDAKFKREYATDSLDEMVAEVMSNNKLRNMLDERGFLQRMYDGFLRLLGFSPKTISEQAVDNIYALFAPAQPITDAKVASVMRGVFPGTNPVSAPNTPDAVQSVVDKVVAKPAGIVGKIMANVSGLAFRTQFIDRFAPIEELLRKGVERGLIPAMQSFQTQYYLRFGEQRNQFLQQSASDGVVQLVRAKDGTITIEGKPGANLASIAKKLRDAGLGNEQNVEGLFTTYLAGIRAKQDGVGIDKLNFENKITQAELDAVNQYINSNAKAKSAFESARAEYREYNSNLMKFLADSGAITREEAARLSSKEYVPFYREEANGTINLIVGSEKPVRIGNIVDQPYLKELVGGNEKILPVFTGAMQNTSLLLDMALRNLQTKDVANTLSKIGSAKIGEGNGPNTKNVVRFKQHGKPMYAVIGDWVKNDATGKFEMRSDIIDGVPAELLVQGMQGIKTSIPAAVRLMGIPADILRKFVTRNPAYAVRQSIRDPLNAWLTTGGSFLPVLSSFKELGSMAAGRSPNERILQQAGAISSNVFSGGNEDIQRILRDISTGKGGYDRLMSKADAFAMQGDAATRAVLYNAYREKGMTHMQALLGSLESMNFARRGVSPTMQFMSMMIPFFNAQIQGLDVIYRAAAGKSTFENEMNVRAQMLKRGLLMAAGTMAYVALMQDDEAYKNATPEERAQNWFVYLPGMDEPVRVPIPFELGLAFKAIPEMFFNTAFGDQKLGDAAKTIGKLAYNTVPIGLPQGIKPVVEVAANYSFYSGDSIVSQREQALDSAEQFRTNTSELAKTLGAYGPLSPIQIEYLIRGYTGGLGVAITQLANPVMRPLSPSDMPEGPTKKVSQMPIVGNLFQPTDGRGIINAAYEQADEFQQASNTLKKMVEQGRRADAQAYAQRYSAEIAGNALGGAFRQQMGDLAKVRRAIEASKDLTPEQKRVRIDGIRQIELKLAQRVREYGKTTPQ